MLRYKQFNSFLLDPQKKDKDLKSLSKSKYGLYIGYGPSPAMGISVSSGEVII